MYWLASGRSGAGWLAMDGREHADMRSTLVMNLDLQPPPLLELAIDRVLFLGSVTLGAGICLRLILLSDGGMPAGHPIPETG